LAIETITVTRPAGSLSSAARRRGLIAILINIFFMWCGFFMVVPLVSVHYVDDLGWAAASIGLALALRQFTQQGLTLVGGALADRLGAKGLICAGLMIRAFGFAAMAWASTFPLLLLATMLAALGGALFESPKSAAIAALTDETNRGRFYSLSGVAGGLGMTIGPLIGSLLIKMDFALVALGAAGCFFITSLVTLLFMPPVQTADESRGLTHGIGMALRDRPFMIFNILIMGYWFMWVQLSISMPLVARAIGGTSDAVSWIYMLNAGLSVALQYPLLRLAERWLRPLPILILGMAIMAAGLGGVALARAVPALLLCVAFFSVGSLLAWPSQQTVTANLANPAALGSYFGVNALALAIGGGLGNYSGGLFYGLAGQLHAPALPWLVFSAVGLAAALGLVLMYRRQTAGREAGRGGRIVALGGQR
jgi:DHA1 family multidrug resistance protein-like MFS transporter